MEETDALQKVDLCAKYLIVQLLETNAEKFSYTVDGFRKGETVYGDYVVTVRKKK